MKLIQAIVAAAVFCAPVFAQESPTTTPGTGGGQSRTAKVISPDLLEDGRVAFRLFAPNAAEVRVQGNWEGGEGMEMTRDGAGRWSVTTSALDPELWAYTFSVDGVRTLDPSNYNVARDGVGFMNTVLVLDEATAVLQPQQVPHGTMRAMWFPSTDLKTQRRMFVYTPPGYEESTARYPVLYLLHGSGGDEEAWPTMGTAHVILDNVIAQGKARPMIVVMPNAYATEIASLDLAGPRMAAPPGVGGTRHDHVANEKAIVGDIVPFVDKRFRTLADRENRAIAGLSMGATITANVGFKRLDVFASILVLSSSLDGNSPDDPAGTALMDSLAPGFLSDSEATNEKLRLLFLGCGTEDRRIQYQIEMADELTARNINFVARTYSGAHEWRVWRHALADAATFLFR